MKTESRVPQEVIVVEGRDDTRKLIEVFGPYVKTIETNGSALDEETLQQIKIAHSKDGVVVFTDPDYQGKRIRQLIKQAVPEVKEAHLSQEDANSHRKNNTLGIEHASAEAILTALSQATTPASGIEELIPLSKLIQLGLVGQPEAAKKRQAIAEHFNLGHLNGKQLQKQLARYRISLKDLLIYFNRGDIKDD